MRRAGRPGRRCPTVRRARRCLLAVAASVPGSFTATRGWSLTRCWIGVRDRNVISGLSSVHTLRVVSEPTVVRMRRAGSVAMPLMVPPRSGTVRSGSDQTSMAPSERPDTTRSPAGAKTAEKVRTEPCSEVCRAHCIVGVARLAVFHTRTMPSARAEAICDPVASKPMDQEPAVALGRDVLSGRGARGAETSHSCALGLSPVTASDRPSGPKDTAWVMLGNPVSGSPTGTGCSPVVHSRTVRSSPPAREHAAVGAEREGARGGAVTAELGGLSQGSVRPDREDRDGAVVRRRGERPPVGGEPRHVDGPATRGDRRPQLWTRPLGDVPDTHRSVPAARGQQRERGVETGGGDVVAEPGQRRQGTVAGDVAGALPEPDGPIAARRGQQGAGPVEREVVDRSGVARDLRREGGSSQPRAGPRPPSRPRDRADGRPAGGARPATGSTVSWCRWSTGGPGARRSCAARAGHGPVGSRWRP